MERLKKGKTRIKMLTFNFPQIASRPGAHNLRCLFRVTFVPKVSKDIFNYLKTFFRIQHFKHIFDYFPALTHCPGCIWAATDWFRSIWVPVRTMLQRCGPGEHHHLIFTWSSSPITWSPSPSLYSSGEICTRVEVRDRLEAGGNSRSGGQAFEIRRSGKNPEKKLAIGFFYYWFIYILL